MRLGRLVLFLFLLSVLASCTSALPPEPSRPGEKSGQKLLAGRAFFSNLEQLGYAQPTTFSISADSLTKGENLSILVQNEDYVYRYYYISLNGQWDKRTFPGQPVANSNWIASSASASFSTATLPEGDNYVVAYSCTKKKTGWDCHNNRWQIHQFEVLPLNLPPMNPLCGSDQECPYAYACIDGNCVPQPCQVNSDCPSNYICSNATYTCSPQPQPPQPPVQPQVQLGEIFVGPLAGWKNVKTDYGAVGDGVADDTAAIQTAWNELQLMNYQTLYFPAGTYRITDTLNLPRDDQGRPLDIRIVGEDPATTKIVWDGPADGKMFFYNPNYASISRLTLDGQGKAKKILEHGPKFSGWTEYVDMVFQNGGICLEAGNMSAEGISDAKIIRSVFQNCSVAGVLISNFNTLQWEIYDSYFKDNYIAVTNGNYYPPGQNTLLPGAGNFHIYQSTFINSTAADTYVGVTGFFSIRDSISIGSNAFHISTGTTSPASVTLQRNTILDPRVDTMPSTVPVCHAPICIGNRGTLVLLDNNIRVKNNYSGRIVQDYSIPATFISIGNKYTIPNWFENTSQPNFGASKLRSVNDVIVNRSSIADVIPVLPSVPVKTNAPIIEVAPGANASVIQAAINSAQQFIGQKPVVHLRAGEYLLDKTIVIPANLDVQLLGEGILQTTRLVWIGKDTGPVVRMETPSKASVRYININGKHYLYPTATIPDGIVIVGDQSGARLRTNQALGSFYNKVGFLVEKIHNTAVELLSTGIIGEQGLKVRDSTTVFATGEGGFGLNVTYDIEDSKVLIRDSWTESRAWLTPRFALIKGQSDFTLHNFFQDHPRDTDPENTSIIIEGIDGKATFIGGYMSPSWAEDPRIPEGEAVASTVIGDGDPLFDSIPSLLVRGNNPNTKVAVLGSLGRGQNYLQSISPLAQFGKLFTYNIVYWPETPGAFDSFLMNDSNVSDQFLLDMFAQTRNYGPLSYTPTPASTSDILLYRTYVDNTRNAYVVTPVFCGNGKVESGEQCDDGNFVTETCSYGQSSCNICNSQCQTVSGQPNYCGDSSCNVKFESTASCAGDCGIACPSQNLVSWWRGEGNVFDAKGDNNGVLGANTSFVAGVVGNAFSFSGNGDYITMGDPLDSSLDFGTSNFTLAFWGRSNGDGFFVTKGCASCGNGLGYDVDIANGGVTPIYRIDGDPDGGSTILGYSTSADLTQWHHYVGSYNRKGLLSMYLDGQLAGTADISAENGSLDTAAPFVIGAFNQNTGYLNGQVDEMAVWRRTLSAQEIQAIYNAGSKGMCKP